MSTEVHHVVINADGQIRFDCTATRDAECHQYPDCTCESWDRNDHQHPFVPHDRCWMQDWFDNDGINPSSDVLDDCDYTPGMSGPITTAFCQDYVEWEFVNPAASGVVL